MGRLQKTGFCSRWLPYRNGRGSCGMQVREDRDESPFSCPVTVWGDSIVPGHPVGEAVAESWLDHWGAAGGWLIRSRAVSVTASAVLVGQDECPARAGPSPLQTSHQEDTGHGQRTLALGHSGRRCSSAWHRSTCTSRRCLWVRNLFGEIRDSMKSLAHCQSSYPRIK